MHYLAIFVLLYYIFFLVIYSKSYIYFIACSILFIYKLRLRGLFIVILAFIISFLSYYNFYEKIDTSKIRIIKANDYSILGESNGRKYIINSKINLAEGDIVRGKFIFSTQNQKDTGIVSAITFNEYSIERDFKSKIINHKKNISDKLVNYYGYDKGTLISSLVIGTGNDIYSSRKESMKNLGLMHILSISGFHILLIINLLNKIKIKKIDIVIVFIYVFFIGTVPAYRVLYIMFYKKMGKILKKDSNSLTGVFFALFSQSFFKPYLLVNIGFILTYLATLGIIIFKKPSEDYLTSFRINKYIVDNLSTTISALILTIPFVSILDSRFSLNIFIGSILVVPIYVLATYISFLASIFRNIKLFRFILKPFMVVVFDFSYYLGVFLSKLKININMISLKNYYFYFLFLSFIFKYKKKPKLVALLGLTFLFLSLPVTDELMIINRFGNPYIRISQNHKVYDIIDTDNNKYNDMIELNSKLEITYNNNIIKILRAENKNEIPKIYFNNIKINTTKADYSIGESIVARYIIFGERLIRVK